MYRVLQMKNSKTKLEVTQSLILESVIYRKNVYAFKGAFSDTTFPL
jgi:hypothetical protein